MSSISTTSSTASANAALQSAAQSIISGSTGNSSMDVSSLVTALVNAKTAGQAAALSAQQTTDNTKLSAYGALSAALSALQSGIAGLASGSTLSTFTATATGTGLAATAGKGAVAGSYTVAVQQIAGSQALSSAAFGATTQLGTGTLTIGLGSQSVNVSIDSTNNTLSGIAAAINGASGNPGVTATVVTGTDGAHLVLRSANSGAANVINVTTNVTSDNGLSSLGVTSTASTTGGQSTITSANTSSAWSQSTSAQDAEFSINGIAATSASNSVTSAISGVTLNLSAAAVNTSQTLNVTPDTTAESSAINTFVSLYNTVVTTMATLTSYNSSSSSQGPLLGDSTLLTIQNALASVVGGAVGSGSTGTTLASIGITLKDDPADGTLVVDSPTLTTALTANPATVASLFNSTNGIAAQLNNDITTFTQTGGIIDTQNTGLNTDLKSVATQQSALADYTAQLTSQYQAQFTALNTLMASANSNSQYLTALFGGANSAGALASANNS
ncbi:flagellar filament capping protein FliD [Paraburkholderia sp. BL21I4N1]|uniref:flagellar filament capping protein FliD n=1 Tax=Paraburkholderia sp. BL21I4N1 TaxID=1938801 RepID=UPI000CFCEA09|nr:flagellar filament capping protein FliD [Paraburkholderia sp. BL21I4N1]PQV47120.1 flagellar hook-associated protein 2 [Paraburkholderia sp. BL21I4N1]